LGTYTRRITLIITLATLTACTAHDAAQLKQSKYMGGEMLRYGAIAAVVALPVSYFLKTTLFGTPVMTYSKGQDDIIRLETSTRNPQGFTSSSLIQQAAVSAVAVSEKYRCSSVHHINSGADYFDVRRGLADGKYRHLFNYKCSSDPDDGTRAQILKKHAKYIQRLWDKKKLIEKQAESEKSMSAPKEDIRRAQQALSDLGYTVGTIDGISGKQTKAALAAFQRDKQIEVSGNLDSQTSALLNSNDF